MPPPIAWSRRVADELWSGAVTPLTFSLLAEPMAEHMVRRRLRQAGFAALSEQPVFRHLRGRVFVNATLIHDVMREIPSVLLSDGVLAMLPTPLQADLREGGRGFLDPRTVATVARLTWNERGWTPWARADLFREEAARVAAEFRHLPISGAETGAAIAIQLEEVRGRLGEFLEVVSWAMIYAYVFFHLAAQLSREWLPEEDSLAVLAVGIPGIRTFEVHDEIAHLATLVRADANLAATIRSSDSGRLLREAEAGGLGEFGPGLLGLLRRHGHRLFARDLSSPTWAEQPGALVEMIGRLASAGEDRPRPDPDAMLARARQLLRGQTFGEVRWRVFEFGLRWCRDYYAVRENMRYHADYFLAAFRRLALAGARQLRSEGGLHDAGDVFYLTSAELDEALRGGGAGAGTALADRAAGRRLAFEEDRSLTPPEVVWGDADPGKGATPVPPRREFRATPASPGSVEGPVRLVRSVQELEQVEAGDVIVATATDPTWTSYLSLASGLVLEVGGLLSHGAIVARELGIPAVVDVAAATELLSSAERIRVDGTAGVVRVL